MGPKAYGIPLCTFFSSYSSPFLNQEKPMDSTLPCSNVWGLTNRLGVGFSLIGIGALGMCLLWLCKRKEDQREEKNWLLRCLFVPGASHGLAGLTTTLVNIYFNESGVLSPPSVAALVVASTYTFICISLAIFYATTRSPEDTVPTLFARGFIWLLLQGFLLLAGSSSHRNRVKLLLTVTSVRNPPLYVLFFPQTFLEPGKTNRLLRFPPLF
jgi:hypothetical protein